MAALPQAERYLSTVDQTLGGIIGSTTVRWPTETTESAVWGLLRIVMAQQVSTSAAVRMASRAAAKFPELVASQPPVIGAAEFRVLGMPQTRANCCEAILQRSEELMARADAGEDWGSILGSMKGIGPWTIAVFKIMVLRSPDELPLNDVGLIRAVGKWYGPCNLNEISTRWRPYRSVACWYLWRTLGNEQLG